MVVILFKGENNADLKAYWAMDDRDNKSSAITHLKMINREKD